MTILVGVYCKDGVVVGTDSAATFAAGQTRTIEQATRKIDIVGDHIIVAGTGQVGLGQRFTAVVEKAWTDKTFQKPALEVGKALAAATIADFGSTSAPKQYGALVAFPCQQKPILCEFSVEHFQPELKTDRLWYTSMGSAQPITDPFLGFIRDVFWADGLPTCSEAVFAVTWTLSHAIKLNPGGVNGPIQMAVLASEKGKYTARLLDPGEIEAHEENVEGAMEHLRKYRDVLAGKNAAAAPDVPKA